MKNIVKKLLLPVFMPHGESSVDVVVAKAIVDHAYECCSTSPHQHDTKKRRISTHATEISQARITSMGREEMFADSQSKNPSININYSNWTATLKEAVWIIFDNDWSEKGEIIFKEQTQVEFWDTEGEIIG